MEPATLINTLIRSNRTKTPAIIYLRALDNGPATAGHVAEECPVAPATAYRNLDQLEAYGLIDSSGDTYRLTSVGELVLCENPVDAEDTDITRESISALSASEKRTSILRSLREQPADKRDLSDQRGVSEGVVNRALNEFGSRGWIGRKQDSGAYVITDDGDDALGAFEQWRDLIEAAFEMEPFIRYFDEDIPAETVVSASFAPADRLSTLIDDFTRLLTGNINELRTLVPIASKTYNKPVMPLIARNVDIEAVVDEEVLCRLLEIDSETLSAAFNADTVDIYVHPEPIPFSMAVFQTQAWIDVWDDGSHCGGIRMDDEDSVTWAKELYYSYQREAQVREEKPDLLCQ